jgi:hypothetical protein
LGKGGIYPKVLWAEMGKEGGVWWVLFFRKFGGKMKILIK